MKLTTLCLGLLLEGPLSGYDLHNRIEKRLGHFQHASFGALYPALGKLRAEGCVTADRPGETPFAKCMYAITNKGREIFDSDLRRSSADESFRSDFLSAMYFADHLPVDELERLFDQKLADQREQRRRLLALPIAAMGEGQRFTVRYILARANATIDFLQGEGRAILTSIQRDRPRL